MLNMYCLFSTLMNTVYKKLFTVFSNLFNLGLCEIKEIMYWE